MKETVLITRNVNCSSLSKRQFQKIMFEDLNQARSNYHEMFYPVQWERHKQFVEKQKANVLKNATEYAEKKWKTEKKRQQYINNKMIEFNAKPSSFYFYDITFFDLDVEPWKNGLPGVCCLNCKDINVEDIGRCFDYIANNKYFKAATGWQLIHREHSRSYIKLILSDEMEKLYHKEAEELTKAVCDFYRGCRYFGD